MRAQNQMLVWCVMAAGLLIAGALLTVSPAAADDGETCTKSSGDVVIAACTRAIASGQYTTQNLASLYTSRGNEYAYKGQYDRAIEDFDQAIRRNRQFARGDEISPVAVGADKFVCCRAILIDCRNKVSWTIRNVGDDAKQCIETCSMSLKC
jgi:tetratricopeptide (TPR) repeat protein